MKGVRWSGEEGRYRGRRRRKRSRGKRRGGELHEKENWD
jgi:hypothetical protein